MKRTLLFLFCALMSTQMFSETLFGYLFPTLAYLERTSCHYMEGNEQNRTLNRLSFEDNMFEIDGNYYIEYNDMWLREDKEGRILVYSEPAKKDLVLYDFTLEIGDTLTTLNIDIVPMTEGDPILPGVKPVVVDYPIHLDEYVSFPIDTLIVTDVSMVMMCDSNQYKKWTFSNGMEYMEYIGNLGADFFAIIRNPWEELPTCCVEEDLVCASIYDRLVYLMDDEKRDLLNIDCPCTSWSNKWQWRTNTWNVLQFDGMAFEQTAQTWQYKLAHDTIIDGKEYTAVTRHWTADEESTKEYVAAVRFAENQKAYIYYDNAEYLLYDFGYHEFGDTLEVFSGINNYEHFKTYKCVITDNYSTAGGIAEDTYVMDIIHPITGDTIPSALIWQEFVGSYSGFLHGGLLVPGNSNYQLLCAYKDNVLAYSIDNDVFTDNDTFIEYGCEYNAEQSPEDLFPTLWGLQRTEVELFTIEGYVDPYHLSFKEYTPTLVNGKLYLCDGRNYFREENNQVLLYAPYLGMEEDLVLYDWTLEVGDTLPYKPKRYTDEQLGMLFRVTDVSTIQLLDGKEYKKWTFSGGYEFVEGIGAINKGFGHFNCLQHTIHTGMSAGERLVCASRNGQLLIDNTEKWGVECQCEIETSYKSQWCDTWNVFVENGSVYPPHEETYRYQLAKDTVIGDYTYTAIVSKAINDALDAPHYVAAVRFTDDRKVYIYYDNAEYLLYDFNVQQGDELEVFAGINNYRFGIKTYKCIVTGVEQYACIGCPATITLHVPNHPDDFTEIYRRTQWQEGVGDVYSGFLNGVNGYVPVDGGGSVHLLCAYQGDELKYTGPLYEEYGCEYNANDPLPLYPWCNQWNILAHGYLGPQEPLYGAKTTIYQLGGDTIINHLRYQQLTRYASDDTNQTKTYVGAIRFTKNNRQVYFYYDNAEYLLYDFKAQVGDTLEVFAGIDNYRDNKTYKHVVTNKEPIQDEQCKVTLDVFVSLELEGEIIHEEKFTTTWIEGVGSPDGIVHNCATLREGNFVTDVLCAYVDDRQMYRTPSRYYSILGCEYNEGDFIEGAFPILSGLQRTVCKEYYGETEDDNSANSTYKQTFDQMFFENDKPYILCSGYLLREEDNMILIYSQTLNKDLVLYDFTLEVGDSLLALYINAPQWDPPQSEDIIIVTPPYNGYVVDHDYNGKPDPVVVTDISTVKLLDGKEYKKWTFNNGMEYVEGIGSFGNGQWSGDLFQLIANKDVPTCLLDEHLVCASKNGQLLYQMDDAEMERLGTTCLCAQLGRGETDNAKEGKIGGRPTPTQWFIVEINQEVIYKLPAQRLDKEESSILSAETFIYTLENDSLRVNGKKYFNLSRYSSKESPDTKVNVGALHFENDNRVWFYHDNAEYLLYDFSAEVGDTLQLFAGIHNYPTDSVYTHVVTAKDTLEDGIARVTLDAILYEHVDGQLTEQHWEKVWLAGLGSTDGIVHNSAKRASKARNNIEQSHVMLCAWRDDECLYTTNHPDFINVGCEYNHDFTAVEDVHTSGTQYQKIIRDGHLYIIHNGGIYNVLGINIAR